MRMLYRILIGCFLFWLVTYIIVPISHLFLIMFLWEKFKTDGSHESVELVVKIYLSPHIYVAENCEIYGRWVGYQAKIFKIDD